MSKINREKNKVPFKNLILFITVLNENLMETSMENIPKIAVSKTFIQGKLL